MVELTFAEKYEQHLEGKRQALAPILGEETYEAAVAAAWAAAVEVTKQAEVEARYAARYAARRKAAAERRARKPLRGRALRNHRIALAIRCRAERNWLDHLANHKG